MRPITSSEQEVLDRLLTLDFEGFSAVTQTGWAEIFDASGKLISRTSSK